MNAKIQFTCPLCQKKMSLPAATVGRQGSCPGCKQVVKITADAQGSPSVRQQDPPQPQQPIPEQVIHFTCPQCSHTINVPLSMVGKQGKCPGCQQVVTITAVTAASPEVKEPALEILPPAHVAEAPVLEQPIVEPNSIVELPAPQPTSVLPDPSFPSPQSPLPVANNSQVAPPTPVVSAGAQHTGDGAKTKKKILLFGGLGAGGVVLLVVGWFGYYMLFTGPSQRDIGYVESSLDRFSEKMESLTTDLELNKVDNLQSRIRDNLGYLYQCFETLRELPDGHGRVQIYNKLYGTIALERRDRVKKLLVAFGDWEARERPQKMYADRLLGKITELQELEPGDWDD